MNTCEQPNYIFKNHQHDKWKFLTHAKYIMQGTDYPIVMEIPCGRCKACLKNQAYKLKQRLQLEERESKTAYFITLTYNENCLKDDSTHIKDLIKFTKKIKNFYRNNFNLKNIKYFGVSEYGDTSMRPHYHIILFNIPIWENDYMILRPTKTPKHINDKIGITYWINEDYFTNSTIRKLWSKGRITISSLSVERINYIVSYLFKSMNGITKEKRKEFKMLKMELPARIQSQNLGLNTIIKNKNDFLNENYIYINGEKVYANKYIDKKAGIYSEERSEKRLYERINQIGTHKTSAINNRKGML